MKPASRHFTDDDLKAIAAAVAEAESHCAAEIVPVVATSSGRYDRAEDLAGLLLGIGAMSLTWVLFQHEDPAAAGWNGLPLAISFPWFVVILLAGFLVGSVGASRVAWVRRFLTPGPEMRREVAAKAGHLFHDHRIHHTAASTGVMIYVSLEERRAVICADEKAYRLLDRDTLDTLCAHLTEEIGKGDLPGAICQTVIRIGEHLAGRLPHGEHDANELEDVLVVID